MRGKPAAPLAGREHYGHCMSRRALTVLVVALVSTAAGVYFATQVQLAYPPSVRSSWGKALAVNLVHYWVWGAAVPLVVAAARRFPLDAHGWRRHVPLHLALGAVATLAQLAVVWIALGVAAAWRGAPAPGLAAIVQTNFHSSYPTYWVILLAATAWRAAGLRARLAEARVDALRAQLQPHFLFNALNSVSSLMYTDPEAADAMIARLSELLRLTLRSDPRREIPLGEELDLVDRYLDIERIRFEERLRVTIDVEAAASAALVPPFLLQPLVENAIRHAVAPRPEGGRLEIAAWLEGGAVRIRVADHGPGLAAGGEVTGGEVTGGVGLANTRARLDEMYGSEGYLELEAGADGGLAALVRVPQRPRGGRS